MAITTIDGKWAQTGDWATEDRIVLPDGQGCYRISFWVIDNEPEGPEKKGLQRVLFELSPFTQFVGLPGHPVTLADWLQAAFPGQAPYSRSLGRIDSFWWVGPLPNNTHPVPPTLHAGDASHIWARVNAAFGELIRSDRYSVVWAAYPDNRCQLSTGSSWRYDDDDANPEDEWERVKTIEEMAVEEVFDEPLAEIETAGIDRGLWKAFAAAVGFVEAVDEDNYDQWRELREPTKPQDRPQRYDGKTLTQEMADILGVLDDGPRFLVGRKLATLDWQINLLEHAIGKDLDADEVVGALDHWAQSQNGQRAMATAVAMAGAMAAPEISEYIAEAAAAGTGMEMTYSDYIDIVHLIVDNEQLVQTLDMDHYMSTLTQEEARAILGPRIKRLGHYFERKVQSHDVLAPRMADATQESAGESQQNPV